MSCACSSRDQIKHSGPLSSAVVTEEVLCDLLRGAGILVLKMTDRGKIMEKRVRLSNDNLFLTYSPSAKVSSAIALDVIVAVTRVLVPRYKVPQGLGGVAVQRLSGSSWLLLVPISEVPTWVTVLTEVTGVKTRQLQSMDPQQQRAIRMWRIADGNQDGYIKKDEFIRCLTRMNYPSTSLTQCLTIFHKYLEKGSEALDYIGFSAFYAEAAERDELRPLFAEFASSKEDVMTAQEFRAFLLQCQAEEPQEANLLYMFKSIARSGTNLSYTHFVRFLTRPDLNPALAPWTSRYRDDMTQPLSSYFINSWHLCESSGEKRSDQVSIFEAALQNGCRRFELELHDGPAGSSGPITSPSPALSFSKVLQIIAGNAFSRMTGIGSDFPVLLLLKDRTKSHRDALESILKADAQVLVVSDEREEQKRSLDSLRKRIVVRFLSDEAAAERTVQDGMLDRVLNRSVARPTALWSEGSNPEPYVFRDWCEQLRLNDGFFAANGSCGYALKPAMPDPSVAWKLTVTVQLGCQLPKSKDESAGPVIDPYVRLKIYGSGEDERLPEARTEPVRGNGFNPVWNETFCFTIVNLELALLSLRVVDSSIISLPRTLSLPPVAANLGAKMADITDTPICEAVLALRAVRRGYRAVGLRLCSSGEVVPAASLLCHFNIEKVIR
jgi:Ca2+-binding EF-hand superfamily protein